jgi:hypothetical protein
MCTEQEHQEEPPLAKNYTNTTVNRGQSSVVRKNQSTPLSQDRKQIKQYTKKEYMDT